MVNGICVAFVLLNVSYFQFYEEMVSTSKKGNFPIHDLSDALRWAVIYQVTIIRVGIWFSGKNTILEISQLEWGSAFTTTESRVH